LGHVPAEGLIKATAEIRKITLTHCQKYPHIRTYKVMYVYTQEQGQMVEISPKIFTVERLPPFFCWPANRIRLEFQIQSRENNFHFTALQNESMRLKYLPNK